MKQILKTIGHSVLVELPGTQLVPARVDTGARLSALWVSGVREENGQLHFVLFDKSSTYYNGEVLTADKFDQIDVVSSNGATERRYVVDLLLKIEDTNVITRFTLTDRKAMTYPILLGRHLIRGKFTVDVSNGLPREFVRELHSHKIARRKHTTDTQEGAQK